MEIRMVHTACQQIVLHLAWIIKLKHVVVQMPTRFTSRITHIIHRNLIEEYKWKSNTILLLFLLLLYNK